MPTKSSTVLSMADAKELLDRAVASPRGIKTLYPTKGAAYSMRFRCYAVRRRDQRLTAQAFPPEDHRHGRSGYDHLRLTIREEPDGRWALYLEPADAIPQEIEEL